MSAMDRKEWRRELTKTRRPGHQIERERREREREQQKRERKREREMERGGGGKKIVMSNSPKCIVDLSHTEEPPILRK